MSDTKPSVRLDRRTVEELQPPCECTWHAGPERPAATFITRWHVGCTHHRHDPVFFCARCTSDATGVVYFCGTCEAKAWLTAAERI